ncbi:hypothetical protein B7463_g8428, partial [Scytalidium lignicola]
MGPKFRQKRHQRTGSSSSWTSEQKQESQKLLRMQKAACHHGFFWSPVFPRSLGDYLRLKEELAAEEALMTRKQLEAKVEAALRIEQGQLNIPKVGTVMNGRVFEDDRSLVLAEKTGGLPIMGQMLSTLVAPWPEPSMFQEYGQQRLVAGKRRIMPPPVTMKGYNDELVVMQKLECQHEEGGLKEQQKDGRRQIKSKAAQECGGLVIGVSSWMRLMDRKEAGLEWAVLRAENRRRGLRFQVISTLPGSAWDIESRGKGSG